MGLIQTHSAIAADADAKATFKVGDIVISQPWSRASPRGAGVGVGFMTITNTGKSADKLIGGSTDISRRVEVHTMTMIKGVMRMRQLKGGLEIMPGETVKLKPGGYHVMFIGLKTPIEEGKTFPATLKFAKAGEVKIKLKGAGIAAMSPGGEASGDRGSGAMMKDAMQDRGSGAMMKEEAEAKMKHEADAKKKRGSQ